MGKILNGIWVVVMFVWMWVLLTALAFAACLIEFVILLPVSITMVIEVSMKEGFAKAFTKAAATYCILLRDVWKEIRYTVRLTITK